MFKSEASMLRYFHFSLANILLSFTDLFFLDSYPRKCDDVNILCFVLTEEFSILKVMGADLFLFLVIENIRRSSWLS